MSVERSRTYRLRRGAAESPVPAVKCQVAGGGDSQLGGGVRRRHSRRPGQLPAAANYVLSLPVLIAVALSPACGGGLDLNQYITPEELFDASLKEYREGDCDDAVSGFQRLAFTLPTRDRRRAEVRFYMAECLARQKRYLEATREYRRVSDQWAQDSLAPLALLRAGEAYISMWRRVELDATYGLSALTVLSELLNRYPSSPAAAEARQTITTLNERFALKEYKAGMYYFRLKAYDSAIIYFRSVVVNWPESSSAPEALLKLVESFERIGYEEDMRDMCTQLQRFYPDAVPRAEACARDTSSAVG
ncbi:MAG: outer membrane protein assembly factor BamD [Gemmatimonadota bacterium]|nr:MAG: outer membrane protein assembly factor BamD [Gemmatimonadota bacterium]